VFSWKTIQYFFSMAWLLRAEVHRLVGWEKDATVKHNTVQTYLDRSSDRGSRQFKPYCCWSDRNYKIKINPCFPLSVVTFLVSSYAVIGPYILTRNRWKSPSFPQHLLSDHSYHSSPSDMPALRKLYLKKWVDCKESQINWQEHLFHTWYLFHVMPKAQSVSMC
jgi:hypothetical protein